MYDSFDNTYQVFYFCQLANLYFVLEEIFKDFLKIHVYIKALFVICKMLYKYKV